jgi:lysyl-tRNA synthetase class 1
MFWTEEVAAKCSEGAQIINDSKTPSGRVHVGALRGVLIHDALYRTLLERGIPTRYLFGVDDYDPLDEIPYGGDTHFEKYVGQPLCEVPPPPGSSASDMAEHYIQEFFQVFAELGVTVEQYRMRDIYRSGRFNAAIDKILRHADVVRRVYKEVSNSDRAATWHPFQAICESCGRIATTEVSAYDGAVVTYRCRADKRVSAHLPSSTGCGHEGRVSPFDGRGKLPWKLEWVAKWVTFPVTIEGAGKDHSTKGGSRDVAGAVLRAIYDMEPPVNCPYEFFLVGGRKMSSSKGVGASCRDMADLLPPEILRFLMIRTKPNSIVNFSPSEENIVKLYNEYDRYHERVLSGKATPDEGLVFRLSTPGGIESIGSFVPNFQLVSALVQMPHLDPVAQIQRRKGGPMTEVEMATLERRMASARLWVDQHAEESEKTILQTSLPKRTAELTVTQRGFLRRLADAIPALVWEDDALQTAIFELARLTPIDQPSAFKALYRVLLDRESGPKAGNLLAFLEPEFVRNRCLEVPWDREHFWAETAVTEEALQQWLAKDGLGATWTSSVHDTCGGGECVEIFFTFADGKRHLRRLLFPGKLPENFNWLGSGSVAGT